MVERTTHRGGTRHAEGTAGGLVMTTFVPTTNYLTYHLSTYRDSQLTHSSWSSQILAG